MVKKKRQPKHLHFRNLFYKYVLKQQHIYSNQWFKQCIPLANQYYTEQIGTKLIWEQPELIRDLKET